MNTKQTLNSIDQSMRQVASSAEDIANSSARNAQQAQMQTQTLQGIQFTSAVSAAAGVMAAFNTAKQARLQQEQLNIQNVMAQQAAEHHFAMWRQTPDGQAFIDWQQRATNLIFLLRGRQARWAEAWAVVVAQAKSQVPPEEIKRVATVPKTTKQTVLMIGWIICFAIALLAGIPALQEVPHVFFTRWLGESADVTAARQAALAMRVAISFAVPLILGIVLLLPWVGLRKRSREKQAAANTVISNERIARVERWGFDPLGVPDTYIGYRWSISDGTDAYVNKIESLVIGGQTTFPPASTLPMLIIPESYAPSEGIPQPLNDLLNAFAQETANISKG